MSGNEPTATLLIKLKSLALKKTTRPASVLFFAWTAIATMPFCTATLFTSESAK